MDTTTPNGESLRPIGLLTNRRGETTTRPNRTSSLTLLVMPMVYGTKLLWYVYVKVAVM